MSRNIQECLFIGGIADGTMQRVNIDNPFWRINDINEQMAKEREKVLQTGWDNFQPEDRITFNKHTYRREYIVLNAKKTIITFYVYEPISLLDAFQMMINYYGTRKEHRDTTQELIDIVEDTNRKV
jgi:hypothetical protein